VLPALRAHALVQPAGDRRPRSPSRNVRSTRCSSAASRSSPSRSGICASIS
jgi:hypothetical protein